MKKQDKCRVAHCRADTDIIFADGTGLCWEHWDSHCQEKQSTGTDQQPVVKPATIDPDVSSKKSSSTTKQTTLLQIKTEL